MHAPDTRRCMDADVSPSTGRRILLLEQDDYLASLLHMLLHREGFEVYALASTDNAQIFIHGTSPPDLIFIDSNWIGEDRIDVFAEIAQRIEWQRVPVIMLMSYYDADKIEHAMNLGVTDYLLQPFEPGELLDIIQRYI